MIAENLLFAIGVLLILLPPFFVVLYPQHIDIYSVYLRPVTCLGGALVVAYLPGLIEIEVSGFRAAGAFAIFFLLWRTNPPAPLIKVVSRRRSTGEFSTPGGGIDIYDYGSGYFAKTGAIWAEQRYDEDKRFASFEELTRDKKFITLVDKNRSHKGNKRTIFVRLPIEGGLCQYSWDSPDNWQDNVVVKPTRRQI